jgi:hypothetical protein
VTHTRLPPKRERPRSGVERAPPRSWPKHERWVRAHKCCVPGCENGPIEFAHVRTAANSGMGIKPAGFGLSLCSAHHSQSHSVGIETFQKLYKIDVIELAAAFVARSPDQAMRDALKTQEDD